MNEREFYELTWPGKNAAKLEAASPTDKILRPNPNLSINFDSTQNLYIEGDNLEVLKILQKSYMKQVKLIYIDPPYNTGHDFIYSDNFSYSQAQEHEQQKTFDDEGKRNFTAANFRENSKSNPRFHSDWCSMIYSRLKLARNLLTDDGVIFISIDDNEQANLRKICDEIFGEDNFIAQLVWQKKYGPANDAKGISTTHEYIIVYVANSSIWTPGLHERNEEQLSAYHNPDNDPRGLWRSSDLSARTYNSSCDYEIIGPTGLIFSPPRGRSWIVNEKRYKELLDDNRITFGVDNTGRPMQKKFLSEVKEGITPETWTPREKAGDNKTARYEIKKIFPENLFDTPKPTKLLLLLMKIANLDDNAIILDFFAGSSTTAHAVMNLNNANLGGTRKFILVQIPESCAPDSEAFKAGYKTICDIGRARIIKAGQNLQWGDKGFRVLQVDSGNYKNVFLSPEEYTPGILDTLTENIKPDRNALDLLFAQVSELGLPLSLCYSEEIVDGFTLHYYGENKIIACFDKNINRRLIEYIAKKRPERALFRDSCFENVNDMINLRHIFAHYAEDSDIIIL